MKIAKPQQRTPPDNTVPLINIVFLMLIFFLFAGTVSRDDAAEIDPPRSIAEDERIRSTGALVITEDGTVTRNGEAVALESLDANALADDVESARLMIAADGRLPADHLKQVLARLKDSGREIVLITRRKQP
ncbi:biopolymer transport protein ExbD [Rhodobium orientis]|uniref:Biopolymer transporter ExbD n=1 Tax=Rhodobium orientis TaxID=34017 RepID=A0A327JR26_9HYPH|nr:biopolymer transporter ExbD [Rhodobium orientis]MBB4303201.1 biopolymer transport protein ExbD [Rhodobium orientis]MBK5951698.1 biopolymer transporter ExbD [Rhodobium orientis]RAI25828.1 biopolymer transporter ExbD [Rhodobium orientis]